MIHKLSEGPLTLTVVGVEQVQGKFGAQVLFHGEDGTDVYLSEMAAVKQLGRLNLDLDSVVGQTLYLEQIKKNGTTYTNVSKVNAGAAPAARAAAPQAQAPARMNLDEIAALYGQCVSHALDQLYRQCEDQGIGVNAEAIQAAAATMFIKATR